MELRSAILEELQTNPLLEFGTNDESLDGEVAEPSPDEQVDSGNDELGDDLPQEATAEADAGADSDDDWDEPAEDLMDLDFEDEFSVLREMQEDLREHFEREYEGKPSLEIPRQKKKKVLFDSLVAETSLQEHLIDQLNMADTTPGRCCL